MTKRKRVGASEFIISSTEDADNLDVESLVAEDEEVTERPQNIREILGLDSDKKTLRLIAYLSDPEMCLCVPVEEVTYGVNYSPAWGLFEESAHVRVRLNPEKHLVLMGTMLTKIEAVFLEYDGVKKCVFEPVKECRFERTMRTEKIESKLLNPVGTFCITATYLKKKENT